MVDVTQILLILCVISLFIYRIPRDTQPGLLRAKDGSKRLMDLGLEFIPMEQIIKDAVESLKNKGLIS